MLTWFRRWWEQGYVEPPPAELDVEFYRSHYPDLTALNNPALARHWREFGSKEGRFPNLKAMLAGAGEEVSRIPASFDWRIYLACYDDLARAGLSTKAHAIVHFLGHGIREERSGDFNEDFYTGFYPDLGIFRGDREAAIKHWLEFGHAEERSPTLRHWVKQRGLPASLVPDDLEWEHADGLKEDGRWRVLAQVYSQEPPGIIPIWADVDRDMEFYLNLAAAYVRRGNDETARQIYLGMESSVVTHEALADIAVRASWRQPDHLKREQHQMLALAHYRNALVHNPSSVASKLGVVRSLTETSRHDEAVFEASRVLKLHPDSSSVESALIEATKNYWWSEWATVDAAAFSGNRRSVYDTASRICLRMDAACRDVVLRGGAETSIPHSAMNFERVLIVADMHLPQCVRYRVNQKLEQLQKAGYTAKAVSWTHPHIAMKELAFHDVVIFYRTPAFPDVVRLIATARALGKITFFEIDDYVFDPVYPPPMATYGGYVAPKQYLNLIKGGALIHSAAELCDYGIASTQPLVEHLGKIVRSGRCFLHRNGFDQHTPMHMHVDVTDESSGVNIFYGSATHAHNSDFINEALPAIVRILDENPQVHLTIAGYLQLPPEIVSHMGQRLKQLPMTENISDYWSAMARSHVNIAVLQPDALTDCKSELKWFEAAAMGIPAVVSPTRNYLDVVDDGRNALIASGRDGWYDALNQLVKDGGKRLRLGAAAKQHALQNYSIDNLAANLDAILQDVCGPRAISETALVDGSLAARPTRKKVALVNVFFPPQSIGGATRVLADNLEILIGSYSDRFDLVGFTTDNGSQPVHSVDVYGYKGIRVYRVGALKRRNMDWHPEDEGMARQFRKFLEFEKPDIVHFHCIQRLTASIVEVAREFGIPYVVTIHDAWWISDYQFLVDQDGVVYPRGHPDSSEPATLPHGISKAMSLDRRLRLKSLLAGARAVLPVSEAFAEIYRENGVTNITTIRNGVPRRHWLPRVEPASRRIRVAHIGGMSAHKGYEVFKNALTGSGFDHLEAIVVDLSKPYGYQCKVSWDGFPVTFIGKMPQDRTAELYANMDVLVAPSIWPESFGLVTREAAAAGVWVVASDIGAIGEDVRPGVDGDIVQAGSAEALRTVFQRINAEPGRYHQQMESRVLPGVAEQVSRLVDLYENL